MNTKQLINNIEVLSATLTAKQLIEFLDIVDELTAMVANEQQLNMDKQQITPQLGQLH